MIAFVHDAVRTPFDRFVDGLEDVRPDDGDVSRRQDYGRAKLRCPLKVGDWIVNLDVDHDGWLNGCVSRADCTTDAALAGP